MIAHHSCDFAALPSQGNVLIDLGGELAGSCSHVQMLTAGTRLELAAAFRHDIYVIDGSLHEQTLQQGRGSFLRRDGGASLTAGDAGALIYRHQAQQQASEPSITLAAKDQYWLAGRIEGLQVTYLAQTPFPLSLVLWQPGVRVHVHLHPRGEEILVLEGVLRDEKGAYPAGSWLCYPPGSGHAPYVQEKTLILLLHGHL